MHISSETPPGHRCRPVGRSVEGRGNGLSTFPTVHLHVEPVAPAECPVIAVECSKDGRVDSFVCEGAHESLSVEVLEAVEQGEGDLFVADSILLPLDGVIDGWSGQMWVVDQR